MTAASGGRGRDVVAIVLALGVSLGLAGLAIAACWAVAVEGETLSENATQVLTGVFGGVIGILGTFIGVRAGDDAATRRAAIASVDLERLTTTPHDPAPPAAAETPPPGP